MQALQFSGLYRYTTQLTPLETEERELYQRYDRKVPNHTAEWRVRQAAEREGIRGSAEDGPIYELHATEAAMVNGKPGHRSALITGPDVDAFLTTTFPDTFPAEQFARYQTLRKEERQHFDQWSQNHSAVRKLHQDIWATKRAKALKLPLIHEALFKVLFPKESRQIKDLYAERKTAGTEEAERKKQKTEIENTVYREFQNLRRNDPAGLDAKILAYVDGQSKDTSGQPRQEIPVLPKQ